jgi:hypothetical protein
MRKSRRPKRSSPRHDKTLDFARRRVDHCGMESLAQDFPEVDQPLQPDWSSFRVGEEPPVWRDWIGFSPQQRLRYLELQRRISFGYNPDTPEIPRTSRFVEPGE